MKTFKEMLKENFNPNFVRDLIEVLDKHGVAEEELSYQTWLNEYHNDNYQDCVFWLRDNDHEDLAEDEEFVSALVNRYENHMDVNYGTWDNIAAAFDYIHPAEVSSQELYDLVKEEFSKLNKKEDN